MKDSIKDRIDWFIYEEANELYNDESNFNNCDPTSGQRNYTNEQIREMIIEELKNFGRD